ncbi:ABC transporter permease [Marinilactibacillus piezotolerans]|uniref:ABC transporter permease n=1 Tax=Marinilactibacillus piezotolerans TaxID=258723 RepID=UPI0009B01EA7|nr:hypothetical protein [Marinilactibacillus piezotolerans]
MRAFKQTGSLLFFSLKKEWLKFSLWVLGCLSFVLVGIIAFVSIYSGAADRQAMSAAMSNPAMQALFGKAIGLDNYTIGAMYSHTMTVMTLSLIGIHSILLVVRNTRQEEEEGMLELFRSLPTGKMAHSTAALSMLLISNILIAVFTILILLIFGDSSISLEGAILTGIIYGLNGLFFGITALLVAQFSANSRSASVTAFSILGIAYGLRIIGDTGLELFSLLSPLGLLYRTEPFVTNQWWPVLVIIPIMMVLGLTAFYLQSKRDMGGGLFPAGNGKRAASSFLKSLPGIIFRLLRMPLIIWIMAFVLLGIAYGSVIGDVETLIAGNAVIEQIIANDPSQSIVNQFISILLGVLSIAAAIPALQVMMKAYSEEKKGRISHLLVGNRSRTRVLLSYTAFSFLVSVFMQLLQTAAFGGAAMTSQPEGLAFKDVVLGGMAYIPALWVLIGAAVFLYGWFPQIISGVWGLLGFCFMILYFSNLFDLAEWVKGISPFYHVPEILRGEEGTLSLILLMMMSAVLTASGFIGFNRRDLIND